MYQEFQSFGEIEEVVIQLKWDKRGLSYGFVRFFDVRDGDILATKLDILFIGGRKLYENILRFQRKPSQFSHKVPETSWIQKEEER